MFSLVGRLFSVHCTHVTNGRLGQKGKSENALRTCARKQKKKKLFAEVVDFWHRFRSGSEIFRTAFLVNPRSLLEKIVTRSLEGGGGSIGLPPPPSTFDAIHPIDLKFGTYSKLQFYFQLNETTWCLIGFHGNNS